MQLLPGCVPMHTRYPKNMGLGDGCVAMAGWRRKLTGHAWIYFSKSLPDSWLGGCPVPGSLNEMRRGCGESVPSTSPSPRAQLHSCVP
jgi:hypothetical protein